MAVPCWDAARLLPDIAPELDSAPIVNLHARLPQAGGPALLGLKGFLENLRIPVLEYLRDASSYCVAQELGLGVGELPKPSRLHASHWQTILNGLEEGGAPLPLAARVAPEQPAQPAPAALPAFLITPATPADLATPPPASKDLN